MSFLATRFKDLVLSVYLYNEWQGYSQLENELIPVLERDFDFSPSFIDAIRKHAADEKKHYFMFKGYFVAQKRMPFAVGRSIGYFDALYAWVMGGKRNFTGDRSGFARLCRAVITTERRGLQQLDALLKWRSIRADGRLQRIFEAIRRDEPSHYEPYQAWLEQHGFRGPSLFEKISDCAIHYSIAFFVIPVHFFNFRLQRLSAFAA